MMLQTDNCCKGYSICHTTFIYYSSTCPLVAHLSGNSRKTLIYGPGLFYTGEDEMEIVKFIKYMYE